MVLPSGALSDVFTVAFGEVARMLSQNVLPKLKARKDYKTALAAYSMLKESAV